MTLAIDPAAQAFLAFLEQEAASDPQRFAFRSSAPPTWLMALKSTLTHHSKN